MTRKKLFHSQWGTAIASCSSWSCHVPITLKQQAWQNDRMAFWRLSYGEMSRIKRAPNHHPMLIFVSPHPEFIGLGIRGSDGEMFSYCPWWCSKLLLLLCDVRHCWSKGLSSQEISGSIRAPKDDSVELGAPWLMPLDQQWKKGSDRTWADSAQKVREKYAPVLKILSVASQYSRIFWQAISVH